MGYYYGKFKEGAAGRTAAGRMDTRRDEIDLILWAVQEGAVSHSQVEECIRDREDREATLGRSDSRSLSRIAVEKGFLTETRLQDLTARQTPPLPGPTVVMNDVGMECPACNRTHMVNPATSRVLGVRGNSEP